MKITDPSMLRIGCAATFCCHLDLKVIDSADDIKAIQEDWVEGFEYEAWDSAHEAYSEIASRWEIGSKEYKECIALAEKHK